MTRIENALWRLAIACAALLLLAPLSPRMTWLQEGKNPAIAARITEAMGWLAVALLLGIAAIVALAVGRRARPHTYAVLGAAAAAMAFGVSAVGMVVNWLSYATGAVRIEGFVLSPVPALPFSAYVAAAGLGVALVLLGRWLWPVGGER